jgi:hypothetical protein
VHEPRIVARRAWRSGSLASLASTVALVVLALARRRPPAAPLNGPSQWVHGRSARLRTDADLRHTAVGYAIHHLSSVFWAAWFERFRPRGAVETLAAAAVTSAVAYTVDWHVAPPRFEPGFEPHVPRGSLWLVYGAFAVGLAAAALTDDR